MAPIAHASRVNTTNQTASNSGFVDATNGNIISGSFTAGKKYLMLAMGQIASGSLNAAAGIRVVHGSTAFADASRLGIIPVIRLLVFLISGGRYGRLLVVRTSISSFLAPLQATPAALTILF